MNKDRIEGKYEQFKGKLKEQWGRLTDDEIDMFNGKREQFFGKIQEKYGIAKDEAEKTVREIEKSCDYCADDRAA